MKLLTTSAIAGAIALAAPGLASAATLQVQAGCLEQNEILPVVGTGFTPGAPVTITGAASGASATADPNGAISTTFLTPANNTYRPQPVTLTASDGTNTATAAFQVTKLGSNLPVTGRLSQRVQWQFAGFAEGQPIYGHFRHRGQTILNYRFGTGRGPCGALSVRARRLPTRARRGKWTIQIDNKRTYSRTTLPNFRGSFNVF